ncbi:MAG: radical SAM protein, partial [Bacteroidetes bacterium]|nr:radical SAM protein [Bacteroidota bacterium]
APIMHSGNTDCHQPIEKKMEITRELLKVCLEFKNPVSIISKNALVLRDLDLLTQLAQNDLVQVMISINSLNEELRRKMEPRTVTAAKRMSVINKLSLAGVPAGVMIAPVIPALNDHEIPKIVELASENGAIKVGYIIVRLNGAVGMIFKDWLEKQFPDRTRRVMNLIAECHGGKVNDSQYFRRMKGSGSMADSIRQLYELSVRKFMKPNAGFTFNTTMFISSSGSQLDLFK